MKLMMPPDLFPQQAPFVLGLVSDEPLRYHTYNNVKDYRCTTNTRGTWQHDLFLGSKTIVIVNSEGLGEGSVAKGVHFVLHLRWSVRR